ncbi:hypothetical protein KY290_037654 [Solanum tuberosum]|uniref:Uncharacterized protein n=1 Tax=Solanum tuberosum TaxID=4113 RepID=A0ABQ7TY09_SOLTU|nr:hypothetical protein KY290_037654 [Solanum tuberosum]
MELICGFLKQWYQSLWGSTCREGHIRSIRVEEVFKGPNFMALVRAFQLYSILLSLLPSSERSISPTMEQIGVIQEIANLRIRKMQDRKYGYSDNGTNAQCSTQQ